MFKESFKYYKSKCPPPTYENVIDFDNIDKDVSFTKLQSKTNHSIS